jgi:hypothetical protein
MSYDLEYSPPGGQKWLWHNKALTYSPWVCRLSDQWGFGQTLWPMSVVLYVDLIDGVYSWRVNATNWRNQLKATTGTGSDATDAIQQAQAVGEEALTALMPEWVKTALAEGWRPPLP